MKLSDLELSILRAAARAPGGRMIHFDSNLDGDPFVVADGQHIDLQELETIPRLIRLGLFEREFGRSVVLTKLGRATAGRTGPSHG